MEKASSFFVIMAIDLYDEVIYVNNSKLKAVGRLIVTLMLMGFAIAFMFKFPDYSWAAVFFVALIVIWDFMYYKDFEFFRFNKKGIEAKASIRGNNIFEKATDGKIEVDFQQEFADIQLSAASITFVGDYRTPKGLTEFALLIKHAKESEYSLEEDNNYLKIASSFQRQIVNQFLASIENYGINYPKIDEYRQKLFEGLYESSFDDYIFKKIEKEIIEKFGHQKAIAYRFNRTIKDLKKIEA